MEQEALTGMVSHLFRQQAGKMTAALVKVFGFDNLPLIEDVVQDTFLTACRHWAFNPLPEKPEAWLMTVARNKAINALKQGARVSHFDHSVYVSDEVKASETFVDRAFEDHDLVDSQLQLLFLCCHPSLPEKSQIALTLQTLCGFSLEEIASGLFMKKEAVKKTLYRTKQEIKDNGLHTMTNYVLFSEARAGLVLQVLYLMFNEGYKTTEQDDLINIDLCYEAMRLCKLLVLRRENEEAYALLALMFFSVARFPSRTDGRGNIVILEEQDRSQWNAGFIAEGFHYLQLSRSNQSLSRYHLEAGIAAVHCSAARYCDTDWTTIIFYYDQLLLLAPSALLHIHRALAVAARDGAKQGLSLLQKIEIKEITQYYLFQAAKGSLYFKLNDFPNAVICFEQAIELTRSARDRHFLHLQIEKCGSLN